MKAQIIIALCLATMAAANPVFICPHETGYFAHPTNPHHFYYCVDGRENEYTCPSDLVWHQSIHQCDYVTDPAGTVPKDPAFPAETDPIHVPTGTRERHTDAPAPVNVQPQEPNQQPHVEPAQPTQAPHNEPEVVTRGRHHDD